MAAYAQRAARRDPPRATAAIVLAERIERARPETDAAWEKRRADRGILPWWNGSWLPAINVKDITVTAELPGAEKDDVKLEIDGAILTVRGEKHEETADKGDTWWRRETSHGSFMRRITLPGEVDSAHAEANKMINGVLEVRLPKVATAKAKSITVG